MAYHIQLKKSASDISTNAKGKSAHLNKRPWAYSFIPVVFSISSLLSRLFPTQLVLYHVVPFIFLRLKKHQIKHTPK